MYLPEAIPGHVQKGIVRRCRPWVPGLQRYRKFESGGRGSGHFGENRQNERNGDFRALGMDIKVLRIAGAPALCIRPKQFHDLSRKVSYAGVGLEWGRQQREP